MYDNLAMINCRGEKFNLQLPEELHDKLFLEEFCDGKEYDINEWSIEHFISSLPDAKGPTILCYNNRDHSSYESMILEEDGNKSIRKLIKVERTGLDNQPERIDCGFWLIDKDNNSVDSITQYEDRNPNVEQL